MRNLRFAVLVCVVAIAAAGCGKKDKDKGKEKPPVEEAKQPPAEEVKPPAEEVKSLYERLGGREAIAAVSQKVLDSVDKNEVLQKNEAIVAARKKVDPKQLHEHLTNFVCKATGGPCEYTGRTMTESHVHLNISKEEWDAMGADFKAILDEMKVGPKEQEELMALIGSLEAQIVTKK
jgi:hemoglobin